MRELTKGVVWMMLVFPIMMVAQGAGDFPDNMSKKKREKIKAYKIGYLTEKLNLTSDEATKFWPVYNDFVKKRQALRREVMGERKNKKNVDELSDAEMEKIVDDHMLLKEKVLVLQKEFHVKIKSILPIKKVFLLGKAERDFKREMIKRMQKIRQGRKGQ
ncbi:MAG: hypothetical protein ACJAZ2_001652 [Glaciecola sp.]|jgi:hypothetical protein